MSLDSGDEASQIEICNDASEYDTRLETLQTETKSSRGVDAKESCVSELSPEARRSLMDKSSKIDMEEIKPITPLSTTHSAEGEKHNSVQRAPFNNFQVYSRQLNMSHQFSHFNVLTHQTFLGAAYPHSTRQNQEGGSYFPSPYSQRRDKEKSSLPGGWDKNCDSSRPYSKRK